MKKLSLNASALHKGEVLTRTQLKKVSGGVGSGGCVTPGLCRITYYSAGSYNQTDIISTSVGANNYCVTLMENGATSCGYDCVCDGWGS